MKIACLSALLLSSLAVADAFVVLTPKTHAGLSDVRSSLDRAETTALQSSFFTDLFAPKVVKKEPEKPVFDPVVIEPDFKVAAYFLLLGGLLDTVPYIQLTLGPLITALGVLFFVQTFRIRFRFDENNNFELVTTNFGNDQQLQDSGENVIVGGANRWDCETIVNYDFFPKGWIDGPVGPILVYFKETQTPSESWNQGPGKLANDEEKVAAGEAVPGQVHFFPAVCNAKQIRAEFEKRGVSKLE